MLLVQLPKDYQRTRVLGKRRLSGHHPNYCIIENSQYTGKSLGDLRKLAVTPTPVKDHQLKLMWQTKIQTGIFQGDSQSPLLFIISMVPLNHTLRKCIEDSADTSIQLLEDYIGKHDQGLITAIRNSADNTIDNRMTITRKKDGKKTNSMDVLND